jgi:membrane protein YqaA with SNARE-associated domain
MVALTDYGIAYWAAGAFLAIAIRAIVSPPTSSPGSKTLTLFKSPVSTLTHATVAAKNYILLGRKKYLPNHVLLTIFTLCGLIYVAFQVDGPHRVYLDECWLYGEFIVWWMGLGILSSVGLGTGMHTGMLFTFPHAFQTVVASDKCGNLNFNSHANMWYRSAEVSKAFECKGEPSPPDVTYLNVFLKVLPVFIFWGIGTAIGEVPPYFIAYMAKKTGEKNPDMEDIDEIRNKTDPISKMQVWMLDFMEWGGFWGIVLMAAWPNAAFDMCGIVCGHLELPLWMFLGATILGKGLMKAPMQGLFFVALFRKTTSEYILSSSIMITIEKCVNYIVHLVFTTKEDISFLNYINSKRNSMGVGGSKNVVDKKESWPSFLWNLFILFMVCYFVKSIFEQLAQENARSLEESDDNKKETTETKPKRKNKAKSTSSTKNRTATPSRPKSIEPEKSSKKKKRQRKVTKSKSPARSNSVGHESSSDKKKKETKAAKSKSPARSKSAGRKSSSTEKKVSTKSSTKASIPKKRTTSKPTGRRRSTRIANRI